MKWKSFLQVVGEGFSEEVILKLRPDRAGVQSPGVHVNWTGQTSLWRTGESQQSTVNLFIKIHPLGEVWEKWKGPWPTCRGGATGARQGRPNRGAGWDLGGCRKPWWPWQLARAGPAPAGEPHWDLGPWLLNCWGYFRCYYFLMFLVCSENQRSEFYVTCHTL